MPISKLLLIALSIIALYKGIEQLVKAIKLKDIDKTKGILVYIGIVIAIVGIVFLVVPIL